MADRPVVPTVTLNNGVEMPAIAAGFWEYNSVQTRAGVCDAMSYGFMHLDAAHDYCEDGTTGLCPTGSNQKTIGDVIKQNETPREEFFITTKVPGCGKQGISSENCGPDSVDAANKNLEELQLDYVDVLLVHFPDVDANCKNIQSQWSALSDYVL